MRTHPRRLLLFIPLVIMSAHAVFAGTVKTGYSVEDVALQERLSFNNDPAVIQMRTIVNIPQDFGKVIGVLAQGEATVFWFESGDGRLRNVRVTEIGPVIIRRSGKVD